MQLVIAGVPGSGKGTQAKLLSRHLGIPHISTGEMFRRAMARGTELGKLADKLITKGHFVPDDVTIGIVQERITEPDCCNGYILDGFPRTLVQAKTAVQSLEPSMVIVLEVSPLAAVERIVNRLTCTQCGAVFSPREHRVQEQDPCPDCQGHLGKREDDTKPIALERIDVYQRLTKPAVRFMLDCWPALVVDGSGSIDAVFAEILQGLERAGVLSRSNLG